MTTPEIFATPTTETIRLNTPFLQLRLSGYSYMNAKAARLLNFSHGDCIRFYHTADFSAWYIANDSAGATIKKFSSLLKFSDSKTVRKVFSAWEIDAKVRANLPINQNVEKFGDLTVLQLINKPFNIE